MCTPVSAAAHAAVPAEVPADRRKADGGLTFRAACCIAIA
jgi:hypothetical protein